jgi:para-aminobenzoate synthetase/4-amino-4-deoxychorismate lyase
VDLDETGFLTGVTAIRERIAAGDVYQVNLTLRAALEGADGAQLLSTLCRRAVPRFAAWVSSPHLGEFVSASPELLCELSGRTLHVEPMKGTAPPDQRAWLERSEKDRAELAMITDLLRDDLHRLCEPRSVTVRNERRFIELPYVVQAVSDVDGVLREGLSFHDVLRAVHPGGSVTGAPREAALETIAQLEGSPRGAYCGTLGFEHRGLARAALLIRTAEREGLRWRYGVGSGITWDSDPQAELDEVRLKLGALTP